MDISYDSTKMGNTQPLDSMILNLRFQMVLKKYKSDIY